MNHSSNQLSAGRRPKLNLLIAALVLCLAVARMSATTDPFLQLSAPILTNGQVQFTLTGESGVRYVIESSTDALNWLPVWTNSDYSITRSITLPAADDPGFYRAWRFPLPRFPGAITARQNIDFRGNNVHLDSFDSADPAKSTNGQYDPAKAQANGDIASELGFTNVGNAYINGKVKTGPSGVYSFGPNGYAGPVGWMGPGLYSPDWYQNDFRFALPSVSFPFTSGFSIPSGSGTNYTILGSANYYVSGQFKPTGPPKTILVLGNAKLYVTGDFLIPSSWEIKIADGASLKVYVGTTTGPAVKGEFGNVNTSSTSDAASFGYYGLPSNNDVKWAGIYAFKGAVYAPQATISLGGGGNTVYDYQGAVVANSVVFNGHLNIHYDANLKWKPGVR